MAPAHFSCDACKTRIGLTDPRIHCLDCADYDLCANCAVGERVAGTHVVAHRTRVFKISGGGAVDAVPSSAVIVHGEVNNVPTPLPTPVSPSHPSVPPPPLPRRPSGVPTHRTSSSVSTLSSVGASAYGQQYTRPASVSSHPPLASGWGPFFTEDMSPTPAFMQLMTSILTYLDTGRTGHLVPEAYSRFLDDQAYVGEGNVWKANLVARMGQTKEDTADKALKRAYDLFSIEYNLRPRPASSCGGMMPLLTLKGFMDITAVEMLCDPSKEWGSISRVIKAYNLPSVQGWGDLPRTVLPEEPHPQMMARVARVTAVSREQGQRELEAVRVRTMLEAKGRQNALDLLDDRRYYYTYN
ncbi:Oleate hydratase [Mycena venus]|uniref:Oleate hydratase n=1 Tax=Mycena venus TaxID=2733690 RepID=A0A8H6YIJ8_9AGAR|nr:Oleate hydratase [Mycena venus]